MKKQLKKQNEKHIILDDKGFIFWLMIAINPEDKDRKIVYNTILFLLQNNLINKRKMIGGKV